MTTRVNCKASGWRLGKIETGFAGCPEKSCQSCLMTDQSPQNQIETINKAFDQDFERFAPFAEGPSALAALDLDQALVEQRAAGDFRAGYLAKKIELAATTNR